MKIVAQVKKGGGVIDGYVTIILIIDSSPSGTAQ